MSNSKNKKKNVTSPASARKMNDVESKISSKQLKPIFQKTQSGFEKVFMHASDMKQLSVRANDAIIVSGNQKNVMFNVWHRDDVPAGSIVIHPMWNAICAPSISGTSTISSPGGGGGVKHLTISTDLQNYYLYSCNSVSVNFTSDTVLTDTHKKMLRDSLFKAYVSSSIQNTYLPSGVCILSFTWNGVRYRFNVVTIDDCCSEVVERTTEEGEIEMGQVLDRRQCMYKITSHTVIYIGSEGENSVSSGDAPRRIAMTEESTIAEDNFYGFCGYCAQIEALLSYTVAHPVNSLCHSQTVASLIKKPKGILLYGPPGTGKTLLLDSFTRYIARINSSAHTYSVCEVNHHILLSG